MEKPITPSKKEIKIIVEQLLLQYSSSDILSEIITSESVRREWCLKNTIPIAEYEAWKDWSIEFLMSSGRDKKESITIFNLISDKFCPKLIQKAYDFN